MTNGPRLVANREWRTDSGAGEEREEDSSFFPLSNGSPFEKFSPFGSFPYFHSSPPSPPPFTSFPRTAEGARGRRKCHQSSIILLILVKHSMSAALLFLLGLRSARDHHQTSLARGFCGHVHPSGPRPRAEKRAKRTNERDAFRSEAGKCAHRLATLACLARRTETREQARGRKPAQRTTGREKEKHCSKCPNVP